MGCNASEVFLHGAAEASSSFRRPSNCDSGDSSKQDTEYYRIRAVVASLHQALNPKSDSKTSNCDCTPQFFIIVTTIGRNRSNSNTKGKPGLPSRAPE